MLCLVFLHAQYDSGIDLKQEVSDHLRLKNKSFYFRGNIGNFLLYHSAGFSSFLEQLVIIVHDFFTDLFFMEFVFLKF